jgi:branched-chain amino acid transport system permease protein
MESIMIVAMIVLGGTGHIPGVILGAVVLSALPEILRYVAGPLQEATGGRLDAAILRQLLVALAMIGVMLSRPRGIWPPSERGKAAVTPNHAMVSTTTTIASSSTMDVVSPVTITQERAA